MTLGSIFSQEDVRFGHPLDFLLFLADLTTCRPDSYKIIILSLHKKSALQHNHQNNG